MANIKAQVNGNWSNTATWSGGVLPGVNDDVFSNNFTVTVDGTYTVLSVRNSSGTGITAGGVFTLANGSDLTCTAADGIVTGLANQEVVNCNLTSGNSATFRGTNTTIANTAAYRSIALTNTGTLNLVGNYAVSSGTAARSVILVNSTGTLNIIGDISNSGTATSGTSSTINATGACTINITGNVSSGAGANSNATAGIIMSGGGTLNITGNVTGNSAVGIQFSVFATCTITGNITAAARGGITCSVDGDITIVGTITSSSTANAVTNPGSGLVRVSGNLVNVAGFMAVNVSKMYITSSTSQWTFQTSAGVDRILYAAGVNLGNASPADVRYNTIYGPGGTLTGTLRVPSAANVLSGVLVDATTGTYTTTPIDIATAVWQDLLAGSDFSTSASIGKLIKDYLDAAISSRLASGSYTAPDNASIIDIKAKTDTINWTDVTDIPTETENASAVRTELSTELARIDVAISTRLADADYTPPTPIDLSAIQDQTDKIPDHPASVESTGAQIAAFNI